MNIKKIVTPFNIFSFLIIVVSIFKLTLINKGFYTFPDERRYFFSGEILKQLAQLNLHKSIELLFSVQGRPGEAVIKIIPNIFQYITSVLFDYKQYETRNTFPLFIFNNIIFTIILIVHYKFSLYFLKNKILSLFSVLLFSTLIISYISLRHADAYDLSLLILYYSFYKILLETGKNDSKFKTFFIYGFIAFFGYCCYPGYIMLFLAIPICYFLFDFKKYPIILKSKQLTAYTFGSISCLLLFELLSRSVNKSYINESIVLSKTIIQGSFEECFSFLFKYLTEVEGITGFFIIIGLLLYSIVFLFEYFKTKKTNNLQIVFVTLFFLFITYSILGYYFHKVVWYARLLKQFIPFIILISIYSLQFIFTLFHIKKKSTNYLLYGLSSVFLINFYNSISEYKTYYYPRDVIWNFYNSNKNVRFHLINEYAKNIPGIPDKYFAKGDSIHSKKYICTYGSIYPFDNLKDLHLYRTKKNEQLIFSQPSCSNFKAYQYEGLGIKGRANLDKVILNVKVYEVK